MIRFEKQLKNFFRDKRFPLSKRDTNKLTKIIANHIKELTSPKIIVRGTFK